MADAKVAGPHWDLTAEYSSPGCVELEADLTRLGTLLDEMATMASELAAVLPEADSLSVAAAKKHIGAAQRMYAASERAIRLLRNPLTYASCLLSVDAQDEGAQALQGRLQKFQKRYADVVEPWTQFLDRVSEDVVDAYLADAAVAPSAFVVRHGRQRRHELLSLAEESLINGLAQDGIHAWGRLYDQLSGTMTAKVLVGNEVETLGLAQANGLLQKSDVRQRQAAWTGINGAWEQQAEACAAAINAIAGWRLEVNRKRSNVRPVHFLDAPVHLNRISRATLDSLLDVTAQARPLARRAAKAMAKATGRESLGPWDTRAPAPALDAAERPIPFAEAIDLIADAYGSVHPDMADFVRMVNDQRWIEGSVSARKRPGAYCTNFAKSKTPRVYMTYQGSATDVITLAHELGHAFHSWVMRDLPDAQRSYGMSLAETASTFGETTVRDALLAKADTDAGRFAIMWEEITSLPSFMLNIPARFEFERSFYERREARPVRPNELKELMSSAWQHWYGDAMSQPDPMFWASKLHFYISGLSFYNFPYLFGYLFSLGVYLRKGAAGADFYPRYVELLRDTGRLSAEDLARRHLDVDLATPNFWQDTVNRLEPRVAEFERLVGRLAPA
ncbi:MAG: M3 family oligoendopeptidase [Gammaproteobacteria bacterium]|nr:M3 family oligoendopeptidase [Gammaproteobacteria bacterium]